LRHRSSLWAQCAYDHLPSCKAVRRWHVRPSFSGGHRTWAVLTYLGLFPQRDRGLRQYRPRQLARMMGPYPTMLRDRRRRRPAAADAPVHAIGRAHSARAGVATHALPRSLGDVVRRMVTGQVGHAVDRAGKRTSAITAAISLNSTYATANRLAVVLAPIAASAELVAVPMFCPTINAQAWSSATAPA